jgi:hypothetical protein
MHWILEEVIGLLASGTGYGAFFVPVALSLSIRNGGQIDHDLDNSKA